MYVMKYQYVIGFVREHETNEGDVETSYWLAGTNQKPTPDAVRNNLVAGEVVHFKNNVWGSQSLYGSAVYLAADKIMKWLSGTWGGLQAETYIALQTGETTYQPVGVREGMGRSVWLDVWGLWRENQIKQNGYTEEIPLRGTVGYSELGMHTKTANLNGIIAYVRPGNPNYAEVLLENGKWVAGCFTLFSGNTFSLS